MIADCMWERTVKAWIDLNSDGIEDEGEPPLEGVAFVVNDTLNHFDRVGYGVSAFDGEAELSVWLPGCPNTRMEIVPTPPEGYELTTSISPGVNRFHFGFRPLADTILPAPHVQRYQCEAVTIPNTYMFITDLAADPRHMVWVLGDSGAYHPTFVDRSTDQQVTVVKLHAYDDRIRFSSDGLAWLRTSFGRTSYIEYDNFHHYQELSFQNVGIPAVGQDLKGRVWFMDLPRSWAVYAYDPGTNTGLIYGESESDGARQVGTNGSVWLLNSTVNDFAPVADDAFEWTISEDAEFSYHIGEENLIGIISAVEISPDGMVWIADEAGALRYNPATDQWTRYDPLSHGVTQFTYATDLALAPDGSVWITSGSPPNNGIAIQIIPLSDQTSEAEWYVLDQRDGLSVQGPAMYIAASADSSLWIAFDISTEMNHCYEIE